MTPLQWEQRRLERNRWVRRKAEMAQEVEKERMSQRRLKLVAGGYLLAVLIVGICLLSPDGRESLLKGIGCAVFCLSVTVSLVTLAES